MKDYLYYLFDVDGTLIDTVDLIYNSFKQTTQHFAKKVYDKKTIQSHIGLPLKYQFEYYLGKLSADKLKEVDYFYREYQLEIFKDYIKLFPGVRAALEELKKREKKLAIVTSRGYLSLEIYLKYLQIFDFFEVIITPESTVNGKPHPEPVLKAIELLQAKKEATLFTGDAVFDIESGSRAGVDTAYISWGAGNCNDFKYQPTNIIHGLEELFV